MAMYKDAKDWFEQNASEGGISVETMISCILCNLDNDDIERYFGVSMEREEDNPGAETHRCPNCYTEVDESDWDEDLGLCNDCATDPLDAETDEGDSEVFYSLESGTGRIVWLDAEDFDYTLDPEGDTNVYPFDTIVY